MATQHRKRCLTATANGTKQQKSIPAERFSGRSPTEAINSDGVTVTDTGT
jgi:hypothetical protein